MWTINFPSLVTVRLPYFDIQIVINGLDTQVYFQSVSLILAFSLFFSFLVMCCAVYDRIAVCSGYKSILYIGRIWTL